VDQQIELGTARGTKLLDTPTEAVSGSVGYLDVLVAIHRVLKPRLYFEIGVRLGKSLSLATTEAIGVDPDYSIRFPLSAPTRVYKMTSDDFFRDCASEVLTNPIDLAFIDGQHWFEFALRDFINIERHSCACSVVVFDDIFPNNPIQAKRDRQTRFWTGDVWKVVRCLSQFRPDLTLVQLDTRPTGLLLVSGLSPGNTVLRDRYDEIIRTYNENDEPPPKPVLARVGSIDPMNKGVFAALEKLRAAREAEQ